MLRPSKAPANQDRRPSTDERRARRSDDPMTALPSRLPFARPEGGFEALVLADSSGCLVAGAGAWPTCEMLAAYAPLFAHPGGPPSADPPQASRPESILVDAGPMEVRRLLVDGSE